MRHGQGQGDEGQELVFATDSRLCAVVMSGGIMVGVGAKSSVGLVVDTGGTADSDRTSVGVVVGSGVMPHLCTTLAMSRKVPASSDELGW